MSEPDERGGVHGGFRPPLGSYRTSGGYRTQRALSDLPHYRTMGYGTVRYRTVGLSDGPITAWGEGGAIGPAFFGPWVLGPPYYRTMGSRTLGYRTMGSRTMGSRTVSYRTVGSRTVGYGTLWWGVPADWHAAPRGSYRTLWCGVPADWHAAPRGGYRTSSDYRSTDSRYRSLTGAECMVSRARSATQARRGLSDLVGVWAESAGHRGCGLSDGKSSGPTVWIRRGTLQTVLVLRRGSVPRGPGSGPTGTGGRHTGIGPTLARG